MEETPAASKPCTDFDALEEHDQRKLERTVDQAAKKINDTLSQIGLSGCRVDEIHFTDQPLMECTMECGVREGQLRCWCG